MLIFLEISSKRVELRAFVRKDEAPLAVFSFKRRMCNERSEVVRYILVGFVTVDQGNTIFFCPKLINL